MIFKPSHLKWSAQRTLQSRAVLIVSPLLFLVGCGESNLQQVHERFPERLYPRAPQAPWVVALERLETRAEPTRSQVEVSLFLFGEEPQPPASILKPGAIAVRGEDVFISDGPVSAIFRYHAGAAGIDELRLKERPKVSSAICFSKTGHMLVADAQGAGVLEYDAGGDVVRRIGHRNDLRPAGVACVGDEIWVSDLQGHCIEVYDAGTGGHRRRIGERGSSRLQFSFPMGIAVAPDGNVCIVDMMNHRVQVLTPRGEFAREIGEAGDCVGCFGRPRDVVVGPDGTIFVTDTSGSRVHAFSSEGKPLLAFGEPDGGVGALLTPSGIAISRTRPGSAGMLPDGFDVAYYILVAEQMLEPGVRVYAWRDKATTPAPVQRSKVKASAALSYKPGALANATEPAINPHWSAVNCSACHTMESGRALAIAADEVDSLCLSCHDGVRARAEAHPIGRLAASNGVNTPKDWPRVDERIGCATCHDVRQHCTAQAARPTVNPAMVRGYDADRPTAYCTTCHQADPSWRFSPHEQLAADGRVKEQSCLYCHVKTPYLTGDGTRYFVSLLKADGSKVCLTCHVRHWDVSAAGHVDRPVTTMIKRRLVGRDLTGEGMLAGPELLKAMADPNELSRRLPLADKKVTCFTCHNPHQRGLFHATSEMGLWADAPEDAAVALRMNRIELCMECHRK
ncbi:MAG: hypothetical protein AABZ08_01010 [Planctomycetota bacterium]